MTTFDTLPARYRSLVARTTAVTIPEHEILATVVVVLYRTDRAAFETTLAALDAQTADAFDVIVVDNGTTWDVPAVLAGSRRVRTYVELTGNHGVTVARNLGAHLAAGPLLVFLDDDAVPDPHFVEEHLRVHRVSNVIAARGRVVPRTDTIYNKMQSHYDLGPAQFPTYINVEGNTSFDRDTFRSLGGYDESFEGRAGHEGIEWTYRALEAGIPASKIVYYPDAVVAHDYADGFWVYVNKKRYFRRYQAALREDYPHLFAFTSEYEANRPGVPGRLGFTDRLKIRLIESLAAPLSALRR
ncbi:glycosyltransferase family 2 protein [Haladaptatus sp. DYSN1]|uniref:glycosyltransferase family 2 protein n=1 Tax=unclassified Haladaptatus TaxID=2622732 RepID=UPI00240659E9|nr:glycosyltransferase [Haladaptatus sp. DYSN1]